MPEPSSQRAQLAGAWIMATGLVVAAIVAGRMIREFPFFLPNGIAGMVLYENAPGILLTFAIGAALHLTRVRIGGGGIATRLAIFIAAALAASFVALTIEYGGY